MFICKQRFENRRRVLESRVDSVNSNPRIIEIPAVSFDAKRASESFFNTSVISENCPD